MDRTYDFIVIGSGLAGINFSLEASTHGSVLLVTKKDAMESNTNYAQGGIAAVLDAGDSFANHVEDTLKAGCFHNDRQAVELLVREGPAMVKKLVKFGVPLERGKSGLRLTREGGHSRARVAFAGDATGHAIEKTMAERVRRNRRVKILENAMAVDLVVRENRCYGVEYLLGREIQAAFGKAVILATGGAGRLFKKTTNPEIATGDGLAMAYRAGARLSDLEFVQFHPTALDYEGAPPFLISEAVRGEGAVLKNARGERFMLAVHEMAELAPRDIVARAIAREAAGGAVVLDISHKSGDFITKRFPMIYRKLLDYGLDMTKQAIPVSPAAHYMCGGVKVNLDGETGIKNLFAFGEVARTGVHGANRLASNSLMEAVVFSNRIKKALGRLSDKTEEIAVPAREYTAYDAGRVKAKIRELMWRHAGLFRHERGLRTAILGLSKIEASLPRGVNRDLIEARNMAQAGRLIAEAALARKKSLGCHFREDEKGR